jgi:hypothetical protein
VRRKIWDVEPRPNGDWAVQREGTGRADSVHDRKSEAVARARELGQNATPQGQVRVKDHRGRIQTEWTYGKDPRRTRG